MVRSGGGLCGATTGSDSNFPFFCASCAEDWIAAAQERLAMTGRGLRKPHPVIASEAIQEPQDNCPFHPRPTACSKRRMVGTAQGRFAHPCISALGYTGVVP